MMEKFYVLTNVIIQRRQPFTTMNSHFDDDGQLTLSSLFCTFMDILGFSNHVVDNLQ